MSDQSNFLVIGLNINESCEFGVLEVPDQKDFHNP